MKQLIFFLLLANISYSQKSDSLKGANGIYTRVNFNYNVQSFIGRATDEYASDQAAVNKMNGRMLGAQIKAGYAMNNWNISLNYRYDRINNLINVTRLSPFTPILSTDFNIQHGINSIGLSLGRDIYISDKTFLNLSFDVYRTFGTEYESDVSTVNYDQLYFDTVSTYEYSYSISKVSDWTTNASVSLNTETKIGVFGFEFNWMIIPSFQTTLESTERYETINFHSIEYTRINRGYFGFSLVYAWKWRK